MIYIKKIITTFIFCLVFIGYSVYAENLPEKFDLREYIDIQVRDQKDTNTCWAFSASSLLSTHLAYVKNEYYTFSPRHMEYVMSKDSLIDNENRYGYNSKKLEDGGDDNIIKQYLVQGTGPILEKNMPFENNSNPIYEENLPLDLSYKQVTEASHILPVYKEWNNGKLIYKDYKKSEMNNEEINNYINNIKMAIKENGGVEASIAFDIDSFNEFNASFNTKELGEYWHSILLVGWDDNYSKDNFNKEVRPLKDGAYIALNSWGNSFGDNGYMYISYEDVSVDVSIKTYIKEIEDVDYDNVYYKDLSLAKQRGETLSEITIMLDSRITGYAYLNLKVDGEYVLKNQLLDDCIDNFVLDNPVKLNNDIDVSLEIMVPDEYKEYFHPYYYTISNSSQFEAGKLSNTTLNGENNNLYIYTKHNVIDNNNIVQVKILKNDVDVTKKFNIAGNIIENNQTGITINNSNADIGEYILKLIYNNQEKTYKFNVTEKGTVSYEEFLKGDVSLDGRISILDLSQIKLYVVKLINLSERSIKSSDINADGKVTVSDISLLKLKLVGIN